MMRCFFCVHNIEPITDPETAIKVLVLIVALGLAVYLIKRLWQ